jgi:DNA-directed RNA polymerase specialized sigma24 family protein
VASGFLDEAPLQARRLTRRPIGAEFGEAIELIEWGDRWYEEAYDGGPLIEIPGVRPMTVRETVGDRLRKTQRYGEWIELDRRTSRLDPALLKWCRRHCNDELRSGTFRFSPKDWEKYGSDELPIPFVPELDHPDRTMRELARLERERRHLEQRLTTVRRRRDELVRAASVAGRSRREVARLAGISFGRVQQLLQSD